MRDNSKEVDEAPTYITCEPLARTFPAGWKDVWFRRRAVSHGGVAIYVCPLCGRGFDHSMIDYLHGDHVWPYSLFGETSWQNYQLICGDCNLSKGNHLNGDIRSALSSSSFRDAIKRFLQTQVESGRVPQDKIINNLLGHNLKVDTKVEKGPQEVIEIGLTDS